MPRSGSLILQKGQLLDLETNAINHDLLVNLHVVTQSDIAHGLRRDQDELPAHSTPSRLNHHGHALCTVDAVHEDIKLIQAADRRTHGFPDTEQQADGRERLFTATERLGLTTGVGHPRLVWFDCNVQCLVLMIEEDTSAEVTLGEKVLEVDPCSHRDLPLELLPAVVALRQRLL